MNNKKSIAERKKKMLKLSLSKYYMCNGEIYKLLNSSYILPLLSNIKSKHIKLTSSLVFGKQIISSEEKFLENLDKYISYVRNTYFINHNEVYLLIEMSLSNKYAVIINCFDDYHYQHNYNIYLNEFRKLFLWNIYDNIKYYSKYSSKESIIRRFLLDIKKYNFDDNNDIKKIEEIFITMLNLRKNNIYNIGIPYVEIDKSRYEFYIGQIENMIYNYYINKGAEFFKVNSGDNYIETSSGTIILFNIYSNISNLRNNDEIDIEFGIKNNYFNYRKRNKFIRKNDLLNIMRYIENYKFKNEHRDICFSNSLLELKFKNYKEGLFLKLKLNFDSMNKCIIVLDMNDINKLNKVVIDQVKFQM